MSDDELWILFYRHTRSAAAINTEIHRRQSVVPIRVTKKRKADLSESLEKLLRTPGSNVIRRHADAEHLCAVPGCRRSGAWTPSTTGSTHWYCSYHSKQKSS